MHADARAYPSRRNAAFSGTSSGSTRSTLIPCMRWLTLLVLLTASLPAAERWESQYFHDVDGEEMKFSSIGFCSETRGVVVGGLLKKNSFKPIAMVTSTGGKTWTQMPMDELGRGVFFLD